MSDIFTASAEATLGGSQTASASAFFGSLGTGAVGFGIQIVIFLVIKDQLPRLYQPRSYLVPETERVKSPPKGLIRWIIPTWNTSSVEIVHKCGLDAYFFLRFLGMLIKIFTPLLFTVLPILLCVNGIGGKGQDYYLYAPYNATVDTRAFWNATTQAELNILAWGNVRPDQHNRYWAHLILAICVVAWCLYVFYDELRGFIRLRQAYLLSPQHRIRASATTVLVQSIPEKWCTREALEGLFDVYPGGIRNIWINRNYDKLLDLVKDRNKIANKLEQAETELVRKCHQAHGKALEADAKAGGRKETKAERQEKIRLENQKAEKRAAQASNSEKVETIPYDEAPLVLDAGSPGSEPVSGSSAEGEPSSNPKVDPRIDKSENEKAPSATQSTVDKTALYQASRGGNPVWQKYIKPTERPTMRLALWHQGWLDWVPWTGEKVDTIDHCRKELARMNAEIERQQADAGSFPLMNSAFIQFNLQIAAHMACQSVTHHVPDQMSPRIIEISPGDVIWENMSMKWWERWIWSVLVTIIIAGLIVLYAIPAAIIGLISHLSSIADTYPFLGFITNLENTGRSWLVSAIQGVLPAILTGLLLLLVPLIMRLLSKLRGTPTGMLVELNVSTYYFWFSFVELFLVITIAAGVISQISDLSKLVTGIPTLLASNIPSASNYYFSYLLLQGLNNSASSLLQVFTLLIWLLWAPISDNTAREKWKRQINLPSVSWGTFFPAFTNLACIGLIYSIISPLMIIFNLLSFILFWFAYRYLTIYVDAFRYDTGGLLFPKAINQMFVGLYVLELCLVGLFATVQGVAADGTADGNPCTPQAIIMVIVILLTILAHVRLNVSFQRLFRYLPITLEDEAAERDESFALLQQQKFGGNAGNGEDDTQGSINDVLEERERRSTEEHEMRNMSPARPSNQQKTASHKGDTIAAAIQKNEQDDREKVIYNNVATRGVLDIAKQPLKAVGLAREQLDKGLDLLQLQKVRIGLPPNVEASLNTHGAISEALFAGMHSSLDELSPEQRDALTKEAFKHEALRARRPVIWIPNDELGVAADEIARTQQYSRFLDISSEGTALEAKGRVVFARNPPDFRSEDLIEL